MKMSRLDIPKCMVGECPIWDVAEQALYFIDIFARKIHRYDPANGATRSWDTPKAPGALAIRAGGGAIYGAQTDIYTLDLDSGASTLIAGSGKGERVHFNDGKTDRQGRFLLGLSDTRYADPQPVGGLYRLGSDRRLVALDEDGICFTNGHCLTPDGRTLYMSDTFRCVTYAWDYDPETGRAANRREFADTRKLGGMPDGATVDADGLLWMALYTGGKLAAFRPDGKVERIIDMPVSQPASVMFGGPGLDQLYVVTIDPACFGQPAEEGAGCLYRIEGLGARGVPEVRYQG
jgi:sugar lactone lactonase YvrE